MSNLNSTPPTIAAAGILRCKACGRTEECTASRLRRYARRGVPWCCGAPMTDAVAVPGVIETRRGKARPPLPGARIEFRLNPLGVGPDVAVGLIDVSDDGACVHLKEAVTPGAEAEVVLERPLGGRPIRRKAQVCWCRPAWGKGFLVEVVFARRLGRLELTAVAQ